MTVCLLLASFPVSETSALPTRGMWQQGPEAPSDPGDQALLRASGHFLLLSVHGELHVPRALLGSSSVTGDEINVTQTPSGLEM